LVQRLATYFWVRMMTGEQWLALSYRLTILSWLASLNG
jgi:hypothetical protein